MSAERFDVLIVDDSPDAADSMAELLSLLGHPATAVYSGRAALEVVRARRPLCVLLDVNMPDMDGLALAQALRAECGNDVMLVALTGAAPDDSRAAEVFALVDHHFIKPVPVDALPRLLRGLRPAAS